MQRSTYPDGILVDTTVLAFTELSKASEILRARTDWTSRGIYSGGAITVGAADDTRIDIAGFTGFAPNGEFVECVGNLASIQLDDDTLAAVNYVVAFYTESETLSQPHETDGQTYATRAVGSYRVRIYEESAFNLLSATDANLANDARDRALLLGKVTGGGAGVTLTASNITSPTVYNNILYASPSVPLTIPGLTLSHVSPGMSTGAGTLDYTWAAGPVYGLQWTSFAGGAGAVVNPTVDGAYSVLDGAGEYLTIDVVISQLSTTTPISEAITIVNLYEQAIPRQSGEDALHRNMMGTGTPSPSNAHGLSLNDLSGADFGLLEEHQDLEHVGGLNPVSSPNIFAGSITFPVGAGDLFSIVGPALSDIFYINGRKLNSVSPTSWQFIPTVIPSSAAGCHLYEVGVGDDEVAYVTTKMSFPAAPRTVTGCWIVDSSDEYTAGAANLALTVTFPAGVFQYDFSWDLGETVTAYDTQDPHVIRLFAADAVSYIDLYINTNVGVANPDASLPGIGVYGDSITIFASADLTQNLPIASLCGWWDALAPRFKLGYAPYAGTREFMDKRIWGNLAKENIADNTLQELIYSPLDELEYSGVLYSRSALHDNFEIYGVAGLNVGVRGGAYYCRGQRTGFAGIAAKALVDNTVNLLYINVDNTLALLDVTADFAGSVQNALEYLLGRSQRVDDDHDSQYPERGIPLYEFTCAGAAITRTRTLYRNVNNNVDPFSVATFTGQSQPVSAFNDLRTAFYYAGLQTGAVEVKLTGTSEIDEHIVQPVNVSVRGALPANLISFGAVQDPAIDVIAVDATGIWELSAGCCVEDVGIYMQADAGAAIEVKDNCVVRGCWYASGTANADVFVISSLAVSNVTVESCVVGTRSGAIVLNNNANTDLYVRDNVITGTANNSGLGYALIELAGENVHVTGSKLVTDNSTDFTCGIRVLTGSSRAYISENNLRIGDGDYSQSELGIDLVDNVNSAQVAGNFISRVVGDTSQASVGIRSEAGSDIFISENTIYSLGVGVYIYSSVGAATLTNIRVQNNDIVTCYHRGISFDITAAHTPVVSGMCADANRIFSLTKGTVAGGIALWGTQLFGIHLEVITGGGPYTTYFEGLSFSKNNLSWLSNAAAGTMGIYAQQLANVGDATSLLGLRINNNQVVDFMAADGGPDALGIFVDFANLDATRGATINSNIVSTTSAASNAASAVWGIIVSLDEVCIDDNVVKIAGTTTTKQGSGILSGGTRAKIADNVVFANWIGVSNLGAGASVTGNQVDVNGLGILSDAGVDGVSIADNIVEVTAINAVTNSVQPSASCACIAANGDVFVSGNTLILSGELIAGPHYTVPDETAHIHIRSGDCKITNNTSSMGNQIDRVDSTTPAEIGHRACHIYYRLTSLISRADISLNSLDNYTNNGDALCGIYIAKNLTPTHAHLTVSNNNIRGGNLTTAAHTLPCQVGEYPFEYGNTLVMNANVIQVLAFGNIVTADGAAGGEYPTVYFDDSGVNSTQEPFMQISGGLTTDNRGGSTSNFATNYTSAGFKLWW